MKHSLLAASLVLVAAAAVGCGGGGGSGGGGTPSDASADDFCGVFDDFNAAVVELGEDAENSELIAALKDTGEELEEVGTPEDISDDARAGFELTVKTIEDLDDDASEKELESLEEDFSDEEKEQSDAFNEYLSETCEGGSGEPSEVPSEVPTEVPTEEPSE